MALQSLLKQRVLVTIPGETEIIPAPDTVYGLDPYLRERPAVNELRPYGELRPVDRRREDHPTAVDAASAIEQLATPD